MSALLGRDAQLANLRGLLAGDEPQRIVVTGPAGAGKTHLVREAVRGLEVVWFDFGKLSDSDELLAQMHAATSTADVFVVDNLHGQTPAQAFPSIDAHVVVTSRRRLADFDGDTIWLGPLELQDAVALFEHYAQAAMGSFVIDDLARPAVAEVVERLDRNPLAIELAAARVQTLPPAELLQRLDRRFALLRARGSGRSLEEALAVDLARADVHERQVLIQLVPFRGGFTLDAAEQVVELGSDAPSVLDVIESLVDASILLREVPREHPGSVRFRLGESMRELVWARADEATTELLEKATGRHSAHFLKLGRGWSGGALDAEGRSRAALEVDNLAAVLERAPSDEAVARAAVALDRVLRHLDMPRRHADVLDRGVEAAERANDTPLLAHLLRSRAELLLLQGELDGARDEAGEAATLAQTHGDEALALRAGVLQAEAARRKGDVTRAVRWLRALRAPSGELEAYRQAHLAAALVDEHAYEEARDVVLHVPPLPADADPGDAYQTVKRLAYAHYYLGNHEQMRRLNERALELARRVGDRGNEARALQGLGDSAYGRGDYASACDYYDEALASHRVLGSKHLAGVLLGNRGAALHRLSRLDEAVRSYLDSLDIHRMTGARVYEAVVAQALGVVEQERGHFDDADFHYARAWELFDELGQAEDATSVMICRALLALADGEGGLARDRLEQLRGSADDAVVNALWALASQRFGLSMNAEFPPQPPEGTEPLRLYRMCGWLLGRIELSQAELDEARQTLHGRLLSKLGGQPAPALARPAQRASAALPHLVVGPHGEWFQVPGIEAVNLRRRRAHRLLLDRLVEVHESGGEPINVYDAFEIGWPGEKAAPEAAAERVYWAIGGLRRLGLEDVLLTSDAGYLLDPGATVMRRNEPS